MSRPRATRRPTVCSPRTARTSTTKVCADRPLASARVGGGVCGSGGARSAEVAQRRRVEVDAQLRRPQVVRDRDRLGERDALDVLAAERWREIPAAWRRQGGVNEAVVRDPEPGTALTLAGQARA